MTPLGEKETPLGETLTPLYLQGETDLLLAAGSYMAIEARSSSCADIAITVQQLTTGH